MFLSRKSTIKYMLDRGICFDQYYISGLVRVDVTRASKSQIEVWAGRINDAIDRKIRYSFGGSEALVLRQMRAKVDHYLAIEKLNDEVAHEISETTLEAYRSRLMVKAIEHNLDRTEKFLKLVRAETVKELEEIRNWMDRILSGGSARSY